MLECQNLFCLKSQIYILVKKIPKVWYGGDIWERTTLVLHFCQFMHAKAKHGSANYRISWPIFMIWFQFFSSFLSILDTRICVSLDLFLRRVSSYLQIVAYDLKYCHCAGHKKRIDALQRGKIIPISKLLWWRFFMWEY